MVQFIDYTNKNKTPHDNDNNTSNNGSDSNSNNSNNSSSNKSNNANPLMVPFPGFPSPDPDDTVPPCLINLNEQCKDMPPVLFREDCVALTQAILISRSKANAVLIGDAGVGKTAIVEELARKLANNDPTLPDKLADSVIYQLDLTNLSAGTSRAGDIEEKLDQILAFLSNPDNHAICFIDEIHRIAGSSEVHSQVISQTLKPAMARNDIKIIGATTQNEYHALEQDPAFARRMSKVIVDELTNEQTKIIIEQMKPLWRNHYDPNLVIDDETINNTVNVANQLLSGTNHRPDNAITLLDRTVAATMVSRQAMLAQAEASGQTMLINMIKTTPPTISIKQLKDTARRMMTGHATAHEFDPDELLKTIHNSIVGQDEAAACLVTALKKQSLGLFNNHKPTTLLFAGPSGCGKTAMVRLASLAQCGLDPIVINANEYTDQSKLNRITGSPTGFIGSTSKREKPFDTIRSNPYRWILIDEFEKGCIEFRQFIMQILDTGFMTPEDGPAIDMSKTIIVATTNAATTTFSHAISLCASNPDTADQQRRLDTLKATLSPEIVGRFNTVCFFNDLDTDMLVDIAKAHYETIVTTIHQTHPEYSLDDELDDDTAKQIVADNAVPQTGARPIIDAVERYVMDLI